MQASNEITVQTTGLLERPVLMPLRPRNEREGAALPALLAQLRERAAADNHPVLAPTHIMLRGGKICGYLSLGSLPTVQAWFDTQHKHAADSIRMIEHGETIIREQGHPAYAVCVAETSPFQPHMERLGFKLMGTTQIWIKEL
jgi:hypothetical protein